MWIARDKDGDLSLLSEKPNVSENGIWGVDEYATAYFKYNGYRCSDTLIDSEAYPEVTFENSPKELIIKW